MHTTLFHDGCGITPRDLEVTFVPRNQSDGQPTHAPLHAGSPDGLDVPGRPHDLSGLNDSFGFGGSWTSDRVEDREEAVWDAVWDIDGPLPALTACDDLELVSSDAGQSSAGVACGLLPPGFDLGGVSIIRLIGEGGMGRVYEAWQSAPRRRVAVKVIRDVSMRHHADHRRAAEVIRRFNLEADVLAGLRHPHIAQIHTFGTYRTGGDDAGARGVTSAGERAGGERAGGERAGGGAWPFFVMEYITDAQPITRFVTAQRLSIRDTVSLFQKVCDAVTHAHARGVTHRDLKPANVLVGVDGEPKVIDFGVARLEAGSGPVTAVDDVIGTLLYMSPEQLRGDTAADARSDVYALGLVLHELLTGTLPDDLQSRPPSEVLRLVTAESVPDTSRVRAAALPECGRDDARGLAVIVATCLEKSPSDRYASAAELAADLERWAAGRPIAAQPPTPLESVRRFARRHRATAAVAAVTVASLATALVGITAFSMHADRQRHRAEEAGRIAAASRQVADAQRQAAEAARALAEEAGDRAEAARMLAEEAGDRAEAARAEAERQATEARSQLYFSNVLLAAEARDRDNLAESRRLLESARELVADAGAARPIELDCLAASLDGAAMVFPGEAVFPSAAVIPGEAVFPSGTVDSATGGRPAARPLPPPAVTPPAVTMNRVTPGTVTAVAWSPDGRFVTTGDAEGRVRRRDLTTPNESAMPLGDHRDVVWSLAFSPDGRLVASASADGTVIVRETMDGAAVASMEPHDGPMYAVAFTPDGRWLAIAGRPGVIELWDTAAWVPGHELRGHKGTIYGLAVSADGRLLASAGADRTVRLWDLEAGVEAGVLADHASRVFDVAFAPDGSAVASAGEDGRARIWDLPARTPRAVLAHPFRVNALAFADTGRRLLTASGDGVVRVWDATVVPDGTAVNRSGPPRPAAGERYLAGLLGHELGVWSIATRPDGQSFASGSADGTTRIWRLGPPLATGDPAGDRGPAAAVVSEGPKVLTVASSPAGDLVATGLASGVVRLRDAATLQPTLDLTLDPDAAHDSRVHAVAFSLDGLSLAAAGDDGLVCTWSLIDDRREVIEATATRLRPHSRRVYAVAFSPDGSRLVTAGEDRTARILPLPLSTAGDGGPETLILRHPSRVFCAAFAPDGRLVATACEDRVVRLWDPADGRELARFPAATAGDATDRLAVGGDGHAGPVNWLAFSPDGGRLATASSDGTVRVWRIDEDAADPAGRLVHVLQGPARQVWKVAFSPDGTRLAAVSADGTGQIWDAGSGRAALMLRGHADEVWAVAFAAHGRTLLTGSWDGTMRIWGLSAAELCRRGGGLGGMARCPVERPVDDTERADNDDLASELDLGDDDDDDDGNDSDNDLSDNDLDDEFDDEFDDDPDDFLGAAAGEDGRGDGEPHDGRPRGRDSYHGGCSRGGCTR